MGERQSLQPDVTVPVFPIDQGHAGSQNLQYCNLTYTGELQHRQLISEVFGFRDPTLSREAVLPQTLEGSGFGYDFCFHGS